MSVVPPLTSGPHTFNEVLVALFSVEPTVHILIDHKTINTFTYITTGDGFFAECPRLCRVLFIGRSASKLFAECQRESIRQTTGTRQRGGLPSAEHSANNNTRQRLGLPSVGHSANQNTRQMAAAVNGRQPPLTLCRVSFFDTRQTILFSLLTSKLFLQSSYNT